MWTLDDVLEETLSVDNILKYVDDYSLYSFYIGKELELGRAYSSPFRNDLHPSFSLFSGNGRIYFKDHATTYKGDIFEFIKIILEKSTGKKFSFNKVLQQIDIDFELGLYVVTNNNKTKRVILKTPSIKPSADIKVTSRKIVSKEYLKFWAQYDITEEVRLMYNATNILIVHYSTPVKKSFFYPKGLSIAYRIGGKYQLYYPYESKLNKFRNNLPRNWVFGYLQLKYINDFVLITKAMKEVMFFRQHFDWDSVAGKSENTMIPDSIMKMLFSKYTYVVIMLDNDEAGTKAQELYNEKYPELISIIYPNSTLHKDVTDRYAFFKEHGEQQVVLTEIKQLVNERIKRHSRKYIETE